MSATARSDTALGFLPEILRVLRSTNQYEHVLHLIVDRIARAYHCQSCAIILIDRRTEYLNIENSIGLSWTFCKAFRRTIATGAIGKLLWTGAPIIIRTADDPLIDEVRLEHPCASCIAAQITIDQRAIGYLLVEWKEEDAFADDDVQVLQAFADAAGLAVNKSLLHGENMRLDTFDRETGLEKYASFLEKLRATLHRADVFGEKFALLLLDVDNFKVLTKTYGYDSSLEFLKELGSLVRSQMRAIDMAGRYGYDEFIVTIANSGLENATTFARTLCRAVEDHAFTTRAIASTVSIGVAAYPGNGTTLDEMLTAAKHALFEAQRAGRNKVFHAVTDRHAEEATLERIHYQEER
jgi:diguanylate cyclase (GGDEF)-like protein